MRPDVDKVIILLTDGLNTGNRFTNNASQIDARTAAVCDNIKTAKIKLFTVRVIEGNARAAAGLRQRFQHVLRRAGGEPAEGRLRLDRREPVGRAAREMTGLTQPD